MPLEPDSKLDKLRIDAILGFGRHCSILESQPVRMIHDDKDRLHSLDGPAVEWEDGFKAYFIEGVLFDPQTWEAIVKRTIKAPEAVRLTSVEARRIAIKRIGIENLLTGLKATALEIWKGYALYDTCLYDDVELEPIRGIQGKIRYRRIYLNARLLSMVDPSTNEKYILRVPPNIDNCLDAVAWTFNANPSLYKPEIET